MIVPLPKHHKQGIMSVDGDRDADTVHWGMMEYEKDGWESS